MIIAIGDNVCDKYLSRGKMYPGGQCVNTCVYARMNGAKAAYLGKYGSDEPASHIQQVLKELGVDDSRSRHFEGENAFALVTLQGNDRVFLGANRGGVAREHGFHFTSEDFDYIRRFQLIYTNLNAFIEGDLPWLRSTGVPVAYDFSDRWTDLYLRQVAPFVDVAILSCAHASDAARTRAMDLVAGCGVKIVLGTIGEKGSYALYNGETFYTPAVHAENTIDTMGAGDAYFAAFLCSLLKDSNTGALIEDGVDMSSRVQRAMRVGAEFAARICAEEGAFGYGIPISGRTQV